MLLSAQQMIIEQRDSESAVQEVSIVFWYQGVYTCACDIKDVCTESRSSNFCHPYCPLATNHLAGMPMAPRPEEHCGSLW